MVPTQLSSIPVSSIITEMSAKSTMFADLTEPEQLQIIASAQQDVCNLYYKAGKKNYLCNNYTDPIDVPSSGGGTIDDNSRSGYITATPEGTIITFTRAGEPAPFTTKPILVFQMLGVTTVDPNTGIDTLTKDGFTAYTAEGSIYTGYIAKEAT